MLYFSSLEWLGNHVSFDDIRVSRQELNKREQIPIHSTGLLFWRRFVCKGRINKDRSTKLRCKRKSSDCKKILDGFQNTASYDL